MDQARTEEDPDTPLVARCAVGDERAFTDLVRRHTPRLRVLAVRFTGRRDEAEEVVQEVFFSAWRNAGSWQPGGPPYVAYLIRLTVNRCIDRDRRKRLRRFIGLDDAPEPADPGIGPERQAAARSEVKAVTRLILALPARQRAAILLAADGERSTAEIAAALDVSTGAAEQLLVRARRTLRTQMSTIETEPVGGER